MMVSTRLWVGGVVSLTRDRSLADRLLAQVRACCQPCVRGLLVCTDGWNAYPGSIRRAFREKVKATAGRGRACLRVWPQLCIATVIKRTQKKRVVEVTRQMTLGTLKQAQKLLAQSLGGSVLNTAFIERLNGTMRERLASLTRKCRHAARRLEALETGMYPASMHLQLVLAPSRVEPTSSRNPGRAGRSAPDSRHGQWVDRSCLEHLGTLELSSRSLAVGRAKTAAATQQADSIRSPQGTIASWAFASSSQRGLMLNL